MIKAAARCINRGKTKGNIFTPGDVVECDDLCSSSTVAAASCPHMAIQIKSHENKM